MVARLSRVVGCGPDVGDRCGCPYSCTAALNNEKGECAKSIEEAKAQMAEMEKRIPAIDRELSKMHKRLVSLQAINVDDDDDEDEGGEGGEGGE